MGSSDHRHRSQARSTTPAIILGSLFAALGLTALGEAEAREHNNSPRKQLRAPSRVGANELRVLDWALWNVAKYYVEPERIDPSRMTHAGLEALEEAIPEVLVERISGGEGPRVRVRVGTSQREFPVEVNALWAVRTHIREVFSFINEVIELDEDDRSNVEYEVIEAILTTLDPHTNLLRPEAFQAMKDSTKGSFGGLGIEVGTREGALTVIRVLSGNPAQKVGMKAGDRIAQIGDESTVAMNLNDAVSILRGPPGTTVRVFVEREGVARKLNFDITRAIIKLDSVVANTLPATEDAKAPGKVGLIQIPRNFAQTTGRELREALAGFEKERVSGVVIDMRGNPGGLLNAAVEVADAFLSSGTIVSTVGAASIRDESRADTRYDFPQLPVVVLVDQGSASATEIVAGALRNLDRAIIVGRRTFGKGSVQVLHDRRRADEELALKLTIAQYLTPGDISIQSVGVSPDLETRPVWVGKESIAYFGTKRFDLVREESLAAHLENGHIAAQKITAGPLHFLQRRSLADGSDETERIDTIENPNRRARLLLQDPEIRIARDLIVNSKSGKRADMLASLEQFVAKQQKIENARITKSLAKRGIDWRSGTAPAPGTPPAQLFVRIDSDQKDDVIAAGKRAKITVTVENRGAVPASRVRAITTSDYSYYDQRELIFGKIAPGGSSSQSFEVSVGDHELARTDRIEAEVSDQFGSPILPQSQIKLDLSTSALPRPHFALGYQLWDDPRAGKTIRGNGDGQLQVGEHVKLSVWVENQGKGDALDTRVTLRSLAGGSSLFHHQARQKIGKIGVGKSGRAELEFEVKKANRKGEVVLQLTVADNEMAEILRQKLTLPIVDESRPLEWKPLAGAHSVPANTALLAAATPGSSIVARTPAGSRWQVHSCADQWCRTQLGREAYGFLARSALVDQTPTRKSGKALWQASVTPPRIELAQSFTQTVDERVHLEGKAIDDTHVRDMFITVYNPSRQMFGRPQKVFYQAAAGDTSTTMKFAADVELLPGNNLIEIHARESDEIIGTHRMWVLRTSGLEEARAKKTVESDGSLPVDTFRRN